MSNGSCDVKQSGDTGRASVKESGDTGRTSLPIVAQAEKQTPPLPSARKMVTRKKTPLRTDVFVLWEKAGERAQPHSNWQTKRNLYRRAQHKNGFIEGATVRSAIIGIARVESRESAASSFQGSWVSQTDGELRGTVDGNCLTWAEDGSQTRLKVVQSSANPGPGDLVTMTVDGQAHAGVLSEDGHLLRWNDGDHWLRVDDKYFQMQDYCDSYAAGVNTPVEMQGWSVTDKCLSGHRPGSAIWRPGTASLRSPRAKADSRYLFTTSGSRPVTSSGGFEYRRGFSEDDYYD